MRTSNREDMEHLYQSGDPDVPRRGIECLKICQRPRVSGVKGPFGRLSGRLGVWHQRCFLPG